MSLPEAGGLFIDGVDQQGPAADQSRRLNATLKGVFHQAGADAVPCPFHVRGELAEKQAWNGVRRLPGADRTRQNRRDDPCRRQPIVSDDAPRVVNDDDSREALFLIGKSARLQPMIERRLAT